MTREEAIRLLTTKMAQPSTDWQIAEVYTMAIKALEQEPVIDKIRAKIEQAEIVYDKSPDYKDNRTDAEKAADLWKMYKLLVLGIIDRCKAESEG